MHDAASHTAHAPDHLEVIRSLSNWWLGHTNALPEQDIFVLVTSLNAAANEIEFYREQQPKSLAPGQGKKPAQRPTERFNNAVLELVEAILLRVDEKAGLSPKQYQDWREFLRIELYANLDRYIAAILDPARRTEGRANGSNGA